jgi:hypothetical protein
VSEPPGLELASGSGVQFVKGKATQDLGWLEPKERKTATWEVTVPDGKAADVTGGISSTRGGVARRVVRVGS